MNSESVCNKHQGGRHCWHEYGAKAYKGRHQTSSPVECCHCGATAVQFQHTAEWIDYSARSASGEST